MTVTFRCGHRRELPDAFAGVPRCGECPETVVSRVKVRPPAFVGTVRGPFARYQDLEPIPVTLRSEQTHGE